MSLKTGEGAAEALSALLAVTKKRSATCVKLSEGLEREESKSEDGWWMNSTIEDQDESCCNAAKCTSCVIF